MLRVFYSAATLFVSNHLHFLFKWCACLHCVLYLDGSNLCSNPLTWFKPFNVSLHLNLCGTHRIFYRKCIFLFCKQFNGKARGGTQSAAAVLKWRWQHLLWQMCLQETLSCNYMCVCKLVIILTPVLNFLHWNRSMTTPKSGPLMYLWKPCVLECVKWMAEPSVVIKRNGCCVGY